MDNLLPEQEVNGCEQTQERLELAVTSSAGPLHHKHPPLVVIMVIIMVIIMLVLLGDGASMTAIRTFLASILQQTGDVRETHAKKRILIAIAKPACSRITRTSRILLALASVALRTGHKLRSKKNTVQANPTPTRAQFSAVNGLQLTSATAIQIKFEYPYKAQHSIKSAVELPNQRSAPHSAIGTTPVYP